MNPRAIVLTGASGFIGRHFLEAVAGEYRVFAIARRSQALCGAPVHPAIHWIQVDLTREADTLDAFRRIDAAGGADAVLHLAGYYDFTGQPSPQYGSVNIDGTRHTLLGARLAGIPRFVFASSVAACGFPRAGTVLTEASAPDGDTPYAESKRAAEQLVAGAAAEFRTGIVRLAAIYSDWCEYEPLFRFLETWLSPSALRAVLAGCGLSAVPYLHLRDTVDFFRRLVSRLDRLQHEVLLASRDGATTHRELYEAATAAHYGRRRPAIYLPKPLCCAGLVLRQILGRALGTQPFERPWMGRMIDKRLAVGAGETRAWLGWSPRERLSIVRRMPFLVQNRKSHSTEWHRRNHAALRRERLHENLLIHRALEQREPELVARFAADLPTLHGDPHAALLEGLLESLRLADKGVFVAASRGYAELRRGQGAAEPEVARALVRLGEICREVALPHGVGEAWQDALRDHVEMTISFGIDAVEEAFEEP
ncbi:MAG: NAD(P)-dependent oxidoreductase [Acidobacteria bacterium]|nr:NAD(P)-dependent oxidoreductase [Acidobacteriota bacterium]